jgi:hypothetical protein
MLPSSANNSFGKPRVFINNCYRFFA